MKLNTKTHEVMIYNIFCVLSCGVYYFLRVMATQAIIHAFKEK